MRGQLGLMGEAMENASGWGLGTHLGDEVLEAGDDVGALKLLVVAKAAGDHDHGDEGQRQVQLRETERGGEDQGLEAPCLRPLPAFWSPW